MVEYPPYVDAYGRISEFFDKIKEALVPTKVTNDFIYSVLGLKTSSFRAMIPLLKKLGFIDESNTPTSLYKEYRDPSKSKIIMAQQVKNAYKSLFLTSEYAYKLKKEEIISKLNTVLGTPADDPQTPKVAGTFMALANLADFEKQGIEPIQVPEQPKNDEKTSNTSISPVPKIGIAYTINLNLPNTNDIEVFNAIFKALKENLLR